MRSHRRGGRPTSAGEAGRSHESPYSLADLDRRRALLDAQRPVAPDIVVKLREYFDIEWTHHSADRIDPTLYLV